MTIDPDKSGHAEEIMVAQTCLGWGADMSDFGYWNSARKPDMSKFSGEFGSRKFFDDFHFTNSPNASLLIVRIS
jgi:hypothetical protein